MRWPLGCNQSGASYKIIMVIQWSVSGSQRVLSAVIAPFDLNKGLRWGDTWFPTARSLQLRMVVLGNQCHCCAVFRMGLQQFFFLYADNSANIRKQEHTTNIMMSGDMKRNRTSDY